MTPRARRTVGRGLLYIGVAVLVVQAAFPFFWMASTSMKPPAEVFAQPPYFIPEAPTWENFWRLFTSTNFLIYFRNSLTVAGLAERGGVRFSFLTYTKYAFPMMLVSIAISHVYVWWRYL